MKRAVEYKALFSNHSLDVNIPVSLLESETKIIHPTHLHLHVEVGELLPNGWIDKIQYSLLIQINEHRFSAEGDNFEFTLNELLQSFKSHYAFMHCFGCLYSDYNPYGKQSFGDMLCFKKQKKEYLKVNSKGGIFALSGKDVATVQEIDSCHEFEVRKPNTGYRG